MVSIVTPHQAVTVAAPSPVVADPDFGAPLALPPMKKQLPAFGRNLLLSRRNGVHPDKVSVVWGEAWRKVPGKKVCVKPWQFKPGRFDWRVVAGLRTELVDQDGGLLDFDIDADRYGPIYTLVRELVEAQGFVIVRYPEKDQWQETFADHLAFACRRAVGGKFRWPSWWSDACEQLQQAAFNGWVTDAERAIYGISERDREK